MGDGWRQNTTDGNRKGLWAIGGFMIKTNLARLAAYCTLLSSSVDIFIELQHIIFVAWRQTFSHKRQTVKGLGANKVLLQSLGDRSGAAHYDLSKRTTLT